MNEDIDLKKAVLDYINTDDRLPEPLEAYYKMVELVEPERFILSCPFCGSEEAPELTQKIDYAVICNASSDDQKGGCGAQSGYAKTKMEAIEKWNRAIRKE